MKKILILLLIFISFMYTNIIVHAQRGCCSWHWWVAWCGSNWKLVCSDWTYSPSCTCNSPKSNTITYNSYKNNSESMNQQCNKKYPWTIYRAADNMCACSRDTVWYSSWNANLNCGYSATTDNSESMNQQCNKKYPWTIYRAADNMCACSRDTVWYSSWNEYNKKCNY